jgi:hypothetical protein
MTLKIKKTLIIITLFIIPILQTEAIEINGLKHYSENEKTRIVIQLNEPTQYKTRFDLEQNISISLLKTRLDASVKPSNINDGLVETVTFENTKNNFINVKVLLARPAAFNVFPLDAPARIVIDVIPVDNVLKPEVVAISSSGQEESSTQTEKTTRPISTNEDEITNENTEVKEKPVNDNRMTDNTGGILSTIPENEPVKTKFTDTKSFINYGLDAVILIALIYMGVKVRGVSKFARLLRKHSRTLKENPVFANMLSELEKGHPQETVKNPKKAEQVINILSTNDEDSEEKKENNDVLEPITTRQYERVQEMAQHDMDPVSISEKSNVPVGEVNLILDLIKSRRSERVR